MHTTPRTGARRSRRWPRRALARGYEYLAITDHSATHGFGDHVTPDELRGQIERVAELNARLDGIELLAGTEMNILPDGSPDYDDELLARLDWVIASVHTSFGMGEQEMTERMVAAIEHPWSTRSATRPGARSRRAPPYAIDIERSSRRRRVPGRCSRSTPRPTAATSTTCTRARPLQAGVMILIDTDAHVPSATAARALRASRRRGAHGSTPEQVANTRPWAEFAALRKRAG